MKECTDRVIGVIDDQGTVVSCNQLTWIGEKWEGAASALNANDGAVVIYGDKTFRSLASRSSHYDYAAFVQGSDEQAKLICSMVTVALNSAKAYYEEKHDKTAFVKSIISDNILLGDIYVRAKELHFASEAQRAVFWCARWTRRTSPPWTWCRTSSPTAPTTLSSPSMRPTSPSSRPSPRAGTA